MTAILRALRKATHHAKHEKLSEDWFQNKEPVIEGVTFYVKYIGSTLVDEPCGDVSSAEGVKTILAMNKRGHSKLHPVSLAVSLKGIQMVDLSTQEVWLEVSIYRISHCSADSHHDHIFTFIATNKNETYECHAFLCPKRKMAEAVTLTIAQAFNLAFEYWQMQSSSQKDSPPTNNANRNDPDSRENLLIDLVSKRPSCQLHEFSFEKDYHSSLHDSFTRLAETRSHPMLEKFTEPLPDLAPFLDPSWENQDIQLHPQQT